MLASLDQATRDFTRRLDELAADGDAPPAVSEAAVADAPAAADVAAPPGAGAPPPQIEPYPSLGLERAHLDLDRRMAAAEAEAERYLEEAKHRADSMVQSIVGAVESEADAMRREAEEGIRRRWTEVEAEAESFLADARRAADDIVENRQRRIDDLSGAIVGLAGELTERMSGASEMRARFDALVVALSEAAGRIAADPVTAGPSAAASEGPKGWWRARAEAAEAAEAQVL